MVVQFQLWRNKSFSNNAINSDSQKRRSASLATLLLLAQSDSARRRVLLTPRFQLAHRLPLQLDTVRAADQPIQDRVSHGRVAAGEVVVPAIHWQLAGDERRTRAATLDQEIDLGELREAFAETAVAVRDRQVFQQQRQPGEQDR